VTRKGSLSAGAALGDVIADLEAQAGELLPARAQVSWLGVSQDYQRGNRAFLAAFALAMVIVLLVLAAQFESFVQPVVLVAGVSLAILGSLTASGPG
jgi:multidrug efflux pump